MVKSVTPHVLSRHDKARKEREELRRFNDQTLDVSSDGAQGKNWSGGFLAAEDRENGSWKAAAPFAFIAFAGRAES
jgi:hypothetical protein